MTKTNKKFMALAAAAVLGTAGIAWAATATITSINTGNSVTLGADFATAPLLANPDGITEASGTVSNGVSFPATFTVTPSLSSDTVSITPATEITNGGTVVTGVSARLTGATTITKGGLGTLVLAGGRNGSPRPAVAADFNNYTGSVNVQRGTLALNDSNALGNANLDLSGDTTLRIGNREVTLGGEFPATPGVAYTNQNVNLHSTTTQLPAATTFVGHRNPVTFDVEGVLPLRIVKAITESRTGTNAQIGFDGVQLRKAGTGLMLITANHGSQHTGGTHVVAGTLDALTTSGTTNRYDTPIGLSWNVATVDDAANIYTPNVGNTAYLNANVDFTSGLPRFDNSLRVDAGATVKLDRDKAFGSFNGEGNVVASAYDNGTNPFVTIWNNNDAVSTDVAFNSAFSGNITGSMNFVLDSRAQDTNADLRLQSLRLTGNNKWNGQTWVVDGILSAKDVAAIGTGVIRVGFDGSNSTSGNLLSDRTYRTQNAATLHFSGTTPVDIKVFTETANANLAADNGASVTYSDISVNGTRLGINPFLDGARVNPVGYNGTIRFDNKISYSGTSLAPTGINVERGTLELFNKDTDIASKDFARITVASGARLSFGPANQNMEETYQVVPAVEARLMGYVNANNVVNAMQGKIDGGKAVMRFHTLDVTSLTPDRNDPYINVNLTLSNTQALKKGTFIPIIYSVNPIENEQGLWNVALNQSRVRVFASRATSNTNLPADALKVTTQAFEHVIYAEVMKDIAADASGDVSPDPKPISPDSGSSGCSTGAFASFAGLLLAPLALLRKKD